MTQTAAKPQTASAPQPNLGRVFEQEALTQRPHEAAVQRLRLLWERRRSLTRAAAGGLLFGTLLAFLLPKRFESTTQLMPPDSQSSAGMAMLAALNAKMGGGLGGVAGDLLGIKSSGALFIGILRSRSVEDRLIERFDLKRVYSARLGEDARRHLAENTSISEERKSGIVSISVTDQNPQRAAALANAYVDQLNSMVAELSTSSAHRERVFLEERLKVAKKDLDDASNQLAQFSSKNNTLDMQQEGKALLDAAGAIAGELIAAQSELEGLRQIYTDNNARVRAMSARVVELRRQLEKLAGFQGNTAKNRQASILTKRQSADPAPDQAPDQAADRPGASASQASVLSGSLPIPTIRSLPLLGAKYSDYYRRAKIQETVFELLTQEYELAKVQEVKETPSVKVLDVAREPEKKSFPPRLLIMFLCTLFALAGATAFTLGKARWEEMDSQDPAKVFAREVFQTLPSWLPWVSRNGSGFDGVGGRAEMDLLRSSDSTEKQRQSPSRL